MWRMRPPTRSPASTSGAVEPPPHMTQCGHNTQSVEFLHCSYRRPAQHSLLPGPACPASVRVVARRPLRRRRHRRPRTRCAGGSGGTYWPGATAAEGRGCSDERCAATRGHPDSAPHPPPRPPRPSAQWQQRRPARSAGAGAATLQSVFVSPGRESPASATTSTHQPPARPPAQPPHPGRDREQRGRDQEQPRGVRGQWGCEGSRVSTSRHRMLHRYGGWQVVTTNHRQSGSPPAACLQRMERVNYPKMAS